MDQLIAQKSKPGESLHWADAALTHLLRSYVENFDIYRNYTLQQEELMAFASFHSRGERYVLSKKANLWAAECNEHVLFFGEEELDEARLRCIIRLLESAETELVKPHSEHMYTYLSAVILCQSATAAALAQLKSYRFRHNYLLSLQGWCHGRLAVYTFFDQQAYSNKDGKEIRLLLQQAFHGYDIANANIDNQTAADL